MIFSTDFVPSQQNSAPEPFHPGNYQTVKKAWAESINPNYWRHGLVINQGNGMNVSIERCQSRLKFIAYRLLRMIFGNKYKHKGNVKFIVAGEGSKKSYNTHYHVLMAVEGDHGWSGFRIKMTVRAFIQVPVAWGKADQGGL
jgi:hypothetical protein